MMQGVLVPNRVRLLLSKGHSCYRPRKAGERKRKSVRGCIVSHEMSALSLVVVKQGEQDIPGLTDVQCMYLSALLIPSLPAVPKRLGPKRASKIRKMFNLSKEDDVRKFVIRREVTRGEGKKPYSKAPKIQRLVTPVVLQRKRARAAEKKRAVQKARDEAADYAKVLSMRIKEKKEKLKESRRLSSVRRQSSSKN